ncbi:MAG: GAF domain-containing protein [Ardenticatenaceae bacterium]|nr:GAF domain-containing protein [Ardenticatenaceae bacterium]
MLAGLALAIWLATRVSGFWLMVLWAATAVCLITLILLYNQRTTHKIELLRRQIATSSAFSQEITAYLDFSNLLTQIATLIQNQFHFGYVALIVLNDNLSVTHLAQVGSETQPNLIVGQTLDTQEPIAAAAQTRQTISISNGQAAVPPVQPNLLRPMRSELALPLVIGRKLIGVLDIQSQNAKGFDADQILAMQSLAAQTAVTIRNANLYEREANRRQLAETLYDVGLALSGTLDRQKVLDLVLEQLATIVPYDRASLLIHRGSEMEIVAARGFPPESNPLQIRIPLDTSDEEDVYIQIHHSQRPLVLPDVSQQANWTHVEGLPTAKSWLGTPLIHGKQVIGMLSLVRETDNPYSQEDIAPATTFAVQAAVALENANLYNEIARFNHQLEYEIQQRTEAVLQLARLDQAKSDFINIAAHELRTPLTTLKGYSQMLLQDDYIANSETHRTMVNSLYQGTVRLHEIVNNLLNVARIENETLTLHAQPISLTLLLKRIQREVRPTITERNLTLILSDVSTLPDVTADLDSLHTVFSHLVANAIKYTPDGGTITITGQKAILNDQFAGIKITISDTGIGIDPDVQELIFTKFYQLGKVEYHSSGKTKFKGGGPGLGLAIVRGIVEAHGGRVWVESPGHNEQTCPGSQFHVLLPLQPLLSDE